ncbi:MAG: [protein-PII] uridylyltransferase [Planctomycetota bacterium]|nr:MAG: [protein-PII] uridylyltransferase [Planctomycetota bacterium]
MSEAQRINSAALVAEAVRAAREELSAGRRRIQQMHDRGLEGLQTCGRLTSLVDGVVSRLFDAAAADAGSIAGADDLRTRVALVALGSYGRRHWAPYSDVDLMLLREDADAGDLAPLVRRFTNAMFDAGLQLGSSLRTPEEAVQLARGDGVVCSSLVDNRLIAGSQTLHEHFRGQFERMLRRRARQVCRTFLDARTGERNQYGASLYLLEPHVKRSRGGLRDLHLLRWIALAEFGVSDPDLLFQKGVLSKFDHHRLAAAQSFLLRLRNEMHFHAASAKDMLDRAEQLRIAALWGYRGGGGMLPVERFMRDYFRHTNHIWQLVRRREAALDAPSTVTRMVLDPVLGRRIERDYRVGVRQISATPAGLSKLAGNLGEVLRIVELCLTEKKPLDTATTSALILAAPECGEEISPAVAERFLELLRSPKLAGPSLRLLHELGYLERIIPPMKHARCLLQFNQYHKYTVDEHSLQAVERAAEFAARTDALGDVYRDVAEKSRLHLALLLHDLGKGYEEDHSDVGRRIAEQTATRLYLDASSAADVTFLVHQHLNMSHLAFRRDTGDRDLVGRFAEAVATPERLRMLLVLSCADLAAVGPGVLTNWKVEVLVELYRKALAVLERQPASQVHLHRRRADVRELLSEPERQDEWFARQIDALPDAFVAARPEERIVDTLRRLRKLPSRGAAAWGQYNAEAKTVDFTAGVDQGRGRGAFSSMAGALSSHGLQILAADAQVMSDELLLLRYVVLDPDSENEPEASRLDAVARDMVAAVDATTPPRFRRVWGQEHTEASLRLTGLPNDVRIDNRASAQATVIEVFTFDRTGLLYALARKIHDLELTIWHAKIGTYIDQVVDVFYVTNRGGGKVEDEDRLAHIRREMLAVIDSGAA